MTGKDDNDFGDETACCLDDEGNIRNGDDEMFRENMGAAVEDFAGLTVPAARESGSPIDLELVRYRTSARGCGEPHGSLQCGYEEDIEDDTPNGPNARNRYQEILDEVQGLATSD